MDIEKVYFCPICGYATTEMKFTIGDRCDCCGYEIGFHDDIDKPNIDKEEYHKMLDLAMDLDQKGAEIPKYIMEYFKSCEYSKDEARQILRENWIENGCLWNEYSIDKKPIGWNIVMAKKQLLNINVDLDS